jgi:polygalacturonase
MQRRTFLERFAQTLAGAAVVRRTPWALAAQDAGRKTVVAPPLGTGPARLNVRSAAFGARGDGTTKDTAALQKALDACAARGGGEVLLPAGRYLTGALRLGNNTRLRLAEGAEIVGTDDFADYPVAKVRWEGRYIDGHAALVYAIDAKGVGVSGPGKITGSDALGGRPTADQPLRHPALIEFSNCDGIHLQGFSTSYHRMWSIHPTNSRNILIEDLTIRSTGGNGDGIDVDSCRHVTIRRCDIATGDDCISLKSGRGLEGYNLHQVTEDVTISDCTFADSIFACIGIGSETSGGIRHVRIENCKFTAAKTFAIYIKSRPGRGAFVSDIWAENLDVSGMDGGFLRVNMLNSGLLGEDPVPGLEGIPSPADFRFENVKVQDVPVLVDALNIHPDKPLHGLVLRNITGTCRKGIMLANVQDAVLEKIAVTGYTGPLLSLTNVTGKGLEGAVTVDGPKLPPPVVAPAAATSY